MDELKEEIQKASKSMTGPKVKAVKALDKLLASKLLCSS